MSYALQDQGNAKGNNKWYVYLFGFITTFIITGLIGVLPTIIYVSYLANPDGFKEGYIDFTLIGKVSDYIQNKNIELALTFFTGIFFYLVLRWFVQTYHKRPIKTLYTIYDKFDWKMVWYSMGLFLIMILIIEGVNMLRFPASYSIIFDWENIIYTSLIISTFIFIGQFGEILLLQSYLFQFLSKYTSRGIVILLISAMVGLGFLLYGSTTEDMRVYDYFIIMLFIKILSYLLMLLSNSAELSFGQLMAFNIYFQLFINNDRLLTNRTGMILYESKSYDVLYLISFFLMLGLYYYIINKKYNLLPLKTLLSKERFIQ